VSYVAYFQILTVNSVTDITFDHSKESHISEICLKAEIIIKVHSSTY